MKWYRLDNAAKLFPSVSSVKNSSVFRVSAVLYDAVNQDLLQQAADHIAARFPMLFLQLRRGVFWNYFDINHRRFMVEKEEQDPCRRIVPRGNNGYLLRVLYYHNRISVEVFHSLTDGVGALEYLKSLLYYYFTFSGRTINPEGKVLLTDDGMQSANAEDSFALFYENTAKPVRQENAFRIRGTAFETPGTNVITGVISAQALKEASKSNGASITAYLTALLIESVRQTHMKYGRHHSPVTVAVPVNLRRIFPSRTLRNFFGVAMIQASDELRGGMEQILASVRQQLADKTRKEYLEQVVINNLNYERNVFTKPFPLFLKNLFIGIGFYLFGERKKTIALSNLGNVELPADIQSKVSHLEALLYPTSRCPVACGICSTGDKLAISFTRSIEETALIQHFFSYLSGQAGLEVSVCSNDWGLSDEQE